MSDALINKYRPRSWDQVVGHDKIVASMSEALAKGRTQTFLLVGPPGTGKTSLARVAAHAVNCKEFDRIEVDGATHTGIDNMREVSAGLQSMPVAGASKVVIVDECQMLSKQAWTSLLKVSEEPPPWAYFFFCTTDLVKVPAALKTRAATHTLRPVASGLIVELLEDIAKEEKFKVSADIVKLCALSSGGSPRQAINYLGVCATEKPLSLEDAEELLEGASEAEEAKAFDLAKMLYGGRPTWPQLQKLLSELNEAGVNPESVRHVVRAYGTKVALGAQKESQAGRVLEILDQFSTPFYTADGMTPLLLACARISLGK